MQKHTHNLNTQQAGAGLNEGLATNSYTVYNKTTGDVQNARKGDVTRGKRKGVKYIIKVL